MNLDMKRLATSIKITTDHCEIYVTTALDHATRIEIYPNTEHTIEHIREYTWVVKEQDQTQEQDKKEVEGIIKEYRIAQDVFDEFPREAVEWKGTYFGCIVGEYATNPDNKFTYQFEIQKRKTFSTGRIPHYRDRDMPAETRYEYTLLVRGGRDSAEEAKEAMMIEGQREHDKLMKKHDAFWKSQDDYIEHAKGLLTYGPDEMSYAEYLKQKEKDDDEKNE